MKKKIFQLSVFIILVTGLFLPDSVCFGQYGGTPPPSTPSPTYNGNMIYRMVNLTNITSINNTLLPTPFSVFYQFGYSYTFSIMGIDDSILWDQDPEIDVGSGATCNVSNSCIIGGFPGDCNISENPLLIDEGSTTQTESKEWLWEEGYYMLQSKALGFPEDSPCIDAGTTDTASNDAALPPGQGMSRCDMGAFGGPYNEGWKYYLVGPLVNYMMGVSPGYPFDANNDDRIDAADIVDCIGYIPPLP